MHRKAPQVPGAANRVLLQTARKPTTANEAESWRLTSQGQANLGVGALAGLALYTEAAAVLLDDGLGEGEARAGPPAIVVGAGLDGAVMRDCSNDSSHPGPGGQLSSLPANGAARGVDVQNGATSRSHAPARPALQTSISSLSSSLTPPMIMQGGPEDRRPGTAPAPPH